MKIKFELEVPTLLEAAEIEEILKNNSVSYKLSVEGNSTHNRKPPKHRHIHAPTKPRIVMAGVVTRKRLTMADVDRVLACIDKHPMWSVVRVSKMTKVSEGSIYRIRNGTHRLQQ